MDHVEDLNRCIRSELSAIETYQQVLEKHHKEFGQHAGFQQLSRILSEHEDSLLRLQVLLQQRGGTPSQGSGVWGTWSKTIMGTTKLFGDNRLGAHRAASL